MSSDSELEYSILHMDVMDLWIKDKPPQCSHIKTCFSVNIQALTLYQWVDIQQVHEAAGLHVSDNTKQQQITYHACNV